MLEVPDWLLKGEPLPSIIGDAIFNANRLLTVQRRHGSIYRSISALLRRQGAIDLATGEALSDVRFFDDPIECHHIFPVAYCKGQGIAQAQYNCLVNRTPLSRLSNQKIGGRAPSHYLRTLEKQGIAKQRLDTILRSHLIEPETLWADDFEAFLEMRTQALVQMIQQAMGKEAAGGALIELKNRQSPPDLKIASFPSRVR